MGIRSRFIYGTIFPISDIDRGADIILGKIGGKRWGGVMCIRYIIIIVDSIKYDNNELKG